MNSFAQETVDGLADDDADMLLVSGGDGRMAINPETGLNKYGCAPRSRDVLAVGSCTASSPTPRALAVVEEARARLQSALERGELMACAHAMMAEIRARLARALDIEWHGAVRYADGLALQDRAVAQRITGDRNDRVLLLEHGVSSFYPLALWQRHRLGRHVQKWGCYWDRDILGLVAASGLKIVEQQRRHLGTTYVLQCEPG